MKPPALGDIRIGVIGLGYVGIPLAVYLSRHFPVTGFDIDSVRVDELARGFDRTHEVTDQEFAAAKTLSYSADIEGLADCNFYIVTVPTPVDKANRPDLGALIAASRTIGSVLKTGDIVVYEFDCVSRSHRGYLRSGAGADLRSFIQPGFLCGLFTRAHQPGRPNASAP